MINARFSKIRLALLGALLLIVMAVVSTFTFTKAETSVETLDDIKTLKMEEARLIVEGEEGVNGLQFVLSMSASEYDALTSIVGEGKTYTSLSTNLFIMPEYYATEKGYPGDMDFLDTYDWAVWNGNEYEYTESDKIRVININANDWVDVGDKYEYTGAIVDVLEENVNKNFISFAYIEALNNDDLSYDFIFTYSGKQATDDGAYLVSSIPNELNEEFKGMTNAQKSWVEKNWLNIEGVEDNTEYLVDIDGKTTFDITDAIYNEDAKELIALYGKENLTYTLTDINGKVKTDRVLDVTSDDSLKLWTIEIKSGDTVLYKGKADIYNSTESAVWNDMSATSGIENGILVRNEEGKIDGYMQVAKTENSLTTEDGKPVIKVSKAPASSYLTVLPIHSKSYYEKYQDGDYTFSYNWKYTSTTAWNSAGQAFYFINGVNWNGTNKLDTWYSNELTLKQIVENWDGFTNFPTREWGKRNLTGMFCTYNILSGAGTLDLFVNFSLVDNEAVNTLVDLNEIYDATEVKLSSIMNKSLYTSLENGYPNAKWYIVDTIKGSQTEILDKDKLDLTAFYKKAYRLIVKDGEVVVFESDFDIYDSTEPLVWNTVSNDTIDYVKVYQFINAKDGDGLLENAVSITDDGFFKATGNEFIYYHDGTSTISPVEYMSVTVLPLHSKSYYQRYYDQNFMVRMDMVKKAPLTFSTVQFLDANYHGYWGYDYGNIVISLDDLLDKWTSYNGTGMTANTDSWTVMTRASANKNETQQFNISLGNITITQPTTETEGLGALKGKKVTVVGDSISTWDLNENGTGYYPVKSNDATNKLNIKRSDTWWQQVLDNYQMELLDNKASGGATAGNGTYVQTVSTYNSKLNVCNSTTALSRQGVNPDIILLYIGVNDLSRGTVVIKEGDDINSQAFYDMIPSLYTEYNEKYAGTGNDFGMELARSLGLDTYARAYAYILYSIKLNYPNADLICVNLPEITSRASQYNAVIDTVAEYYGYPVVDLHSAFVNAGGKYGDYCCDGLHPNEYGFDIMSNAVIAKMDELYGK